jgi:Protein of unknown function (DUF1574)
MTNNWAITKSRFVGALSLFLVFNFILNQQDALLGFAPSTAKAKLFDYPGAEANVLALNEPPNVLLIGSSLLIHPEWCVDRNLPVEGTLAQATIVSECHYHLARGLDNELRRVGFQNPHVYNLAVGGGLMSDSYLLLRRYLKAHPKPEVIVLDCAPRSFYDSHVTEPDRTPVFDYFFSLQDFCELQNLYLGKFTNQVNYLFSRLCFTYHHGKALCDSGQEKVQSFLLAARTKEPAAPLAPPVAAEPAAPAAPAAPSVTPVTPVTVTALAPISIPRKISGGIPSSDVQAQDQGKMAESLKEYFWRYEGLDQNQLINQMKFMDRISELCDSRQIKLIVVGMPLTEGNKRLLPKGFYDGFTQKIQTTLAARRTVFLNLATLQGWSQDCFSDSVHMNEKGGVRLNQLLAQVVAQNVSPKTLAKSIDDR